MLVSSRPGLKAYRSILDVPCVHTSGWSSAPYSSEIPQNYLWKQHIVTQLINLPVCLCTEMLSCGKTCEADSNHQWLGVSLSRQPGDNGGRILVTHTFLSPKHRHTHSHTSGHIRLHVVSSIHMPFQCIKHKLIGEVKILWHFTPKKPLFYCYVTAVQCCVLVK